MWRGQYPRPGSAKWFSQTPKGPWSSLLEIERAPYSLRCGRAARGARPWHGACRTAHGRGAPACVSRCPERPCPQTAGGSSGRRPGCGQRPWGPWGHRQQGAAIVQGPTPLPDGEDEGGRAEGQQPGGGKRQVIGPQPDAQEPAAVGREGGPDLMAEEHPAKEDRAGAGSKEVGRQADGGGHRGNPVKAVDHAKEGELRQIIGIRQVQQ